MRSYIVIVSPSYGGAEKRFFDIFSGLRDRGVDVHLIAPSSLVTQLQQDHPEREHLFEAMISVALVSRQPPRVGWLRSHWRAGQGAVLAKACALARTATPPCASRTSRHRHFGVDATLEAWSRVRFVLEFRKVLRGLPRASRFHYPMNCLWFLHLGRGDKVSMSMADCVRVPGPFSGTHTSVLTWIAFFFVTRIDVLSPAILAAMAHYRRASRMTLTPGGTFLMPPSGPIPPKRPTVVFLGRLVPLKGIDNFLDVLPAVFARLQGRVPADFCFEIAGYGPLEAHVAERTAALARAGVPIRFVGYAAAADILSRAAVLVSMQEVTNYPSRVVAEALVAGTSVLVRDTGDSRQFGTELPGLRYCQATLDPQELADALAELVLRSGSDPAYPRLVSDAAVLRFSSKEYLAYFQDILHGGLA